MTRNPDLLSINCSNCGAGLDVLGGGRVVVQVCPYCGSELDAQDNYRVLRQFKDQERPQTPFTMGMVGTLFEVEFTVIGLLEHTERWAGRVYTWIDHQLYSPTHGYAWLTLEAGHLTFSRRYRGPGWISERQVEMSDNPPNAYADGEKFQYFETTTSSITYVEGEFTWHPKVGEKTTTISAMSQTAMLGFSTNGSERETYRTIYVTQAQAERGFGQSLNLNPYRVHPLQPFVAGPNFQFLLVSSLCFTMVCLAMAFVLNHRPGYLVTHSQKISADDFPAEITIPLKDDSQLTQISFAGDVINSWAYLDLELLDPKGEPVFQAGRTVEAYSGRDADGAWREGTGHASLRFRPEQTGDYTLTLDVPEQGVWTGRDVGHVPKRPFNQLTVTIRSHLSSGRWAMALSGVFGVLFLFQFGRKWLHHKARWSGTDWVDED